MFMIRRPNCVKAVLFILMVSYVAATKSTMNDKKAGGEGDLLSRHRETEKKNLRVSLNDGRLDIGETVMTADDKSDSLEEDKELWDRILQRELSFPTPAPQLAIIPPTKMPVMIQEDEVCELMVNVECLEVEGSARIPCGQVPKPQDEDQCVRDVQYVYRVMNSCNPLEFNCDAAQIKAFDQVRNGVLKNLLPLVPQNTRIAPTETEFFIEDGLEFDFCSNQTVDTSVRIIADTAPGMGAGMCTATGANFFSVGFVPDLPCKVAVDLACFVENGDERINCKDIPMPEDEEDCIKEVVYATIVTNIGDKDKTILSLDRTRDGVSANLLGLLDKRDLSPGEFVAAREEGQVLDFCVQRLVTTTVEVTSEAMGVGQLECSEQVTLVFSIAITCDVDVKVQCFADASRDFSVPCSDFNPFDSQSLMVGCEHIHKYVYTIENTGPGEEVIESIFVTRDGVTSNILDRRFNLDPDEVREINEFQLVDYCKDYPNGIVTDVEVNADMFPIGGSCKAVDSIAVSPAMEECNVSLDPFIKCTVETPDGNNEPCSAYHEQIKNLDDPNQCMREVTFEYTLVNEGLACLLIYSVTAEIDRDGVFDLTPAMGKTLCPEESLTLEQKHIEDFCDEDLEDRVVVVVNDGPPETCGGFGALGFFLPITELECAIELDLNCATSTGEGCIVKSGAETLCDFHPCYIDLLFSAGDCNSSQNSQDDTFLCYDIGDVKSLSSAFVTIQSFHGTEYYADTVQRGETLRLGNEYKKLDEGMIVKIYDFKGGALVQKFKFASKCYKPLYTNDVFGAFTVSGFGNRKNQVTATSSSGSGSEFELTYSILNSGENDAFLNEIVFASDDSTLSTSIDLSGNTVQIGRTFTGSNVFDLSSISKETIVTATVKADSPSDLECTALNTVTIGYESTPSVPVPEPKQVQCLDCPKTFLFKFRGGSCGQSSNSQDIQCTDEASIPDAAHVIITDRHFKYIFFENMVNKGDILEVSAAHSSFRTDLVVRVIDGGDVVAQIIKFHSSCSKPIFLGDTFGSIQIVGWTNYKQGVVKLY